MGQNRSDLTKQWKVLISEFLEPSNKKIYEKPIGRYYGRKGLDDRRIRILRMTCDLLLNSQFLKPATKLYISNRYITYEGVTEILAKQGKDTNASTVQSTVFNDTDRFNTRLSKSFFVDLVEYNKNIEEHEQRVVNTLIHYSGASRLFSSMALKMPEHTVRLEAADDEFWDFVQIIGPYSPYHMKTIQEIMPVDMLGYCKYLVSCTLLNEKEKQQKQVLLDMLNKEMIS